MSRSGYSERFEKLLCLAALGFAIELVFFKFLPDLSTALIQGYPSNLTDFSLFERDYIVRGSLFSTRVLGNHIFWQVAQFVGHFVHSHDVRLHPLRITAGILTPLYAWAGAYPALRRKSGLNWRYFMAAYAVTVVISLYLFYPYDMPAFAALSVAMYFLVREHRGWALAFMLLTGLTRESAFHVVTWVALWALCSRSMPLGRRLTWVCAFAVAFILEYLAVRHYFPGPLTSVGGVVVDLRAIFLGRQMLSFTNICSVGMELVLAALCLNRLRDADPGDWRRRFFLVNCYALPAWMIFYVMMNANLAEFRLLLPAVLPCIYGLAFATSAPARRSDGIVTNR
jgi:hypothetical protein